MIFYDFFITEVPKNEVASCYVSIHNQFVEIYLLCHSDVAKKAKSYIEDSGLFKQEQWNKKYPKLLKILNEHGVIEGYSYDHRFSCVGESEEEPNVEIFLRNNTIIFETLEQVRKEHYIWDEERFPHLSVSFLKKAN